MNFKHKELNKIFGLESDHKIPFIYLENPLVEVLKTQKELRKTSYYCYRYDEREKGRKLEELSNKFKEAGKTIGKFFEILQGW